jgi:hypothetical protein
MSPVRLGGAGSIEARQQDQHRGMTIPRLITELGLTSKCSATSRREAPDLISSIARSHKSPEYGLGIEFPPRIKPLSGESFIAQTLGIPSDSTTPGYALIRRMW